MFEKGDTIAALAAKKDQRRVLILVMIINFVMFFAEFGGGVIARSSALMADSVDMLGDAFIYALSLYALRRGPRWEAGAAIAKGAIILLFGIAVIVEIGDKIVNGVPPSSGLMMAVGGAALAANLACLALLWPFRKLNVNMSSTFACS
ncbi:MAG TPA: cation transporter, partial [Sphingobium sp.]